MIRVLFTLLFSLSVGCILAQTDGDYQSDQNGNWSTATTWEVFFNAAWRDLETVAAGPFRNVIPSNTAGIITVKHAVVVNANTTTNQTVIDASGVLTVYGGRTLIIQDDGVNTPLQIIAGGRLVNNGILDLETQMTSTPCQVFGTLFSNSTIRASNPSLLIFQPASIYVHFHRTGGRVPSATWDISSICRISGMTITKPAPPSNLAQTFGNFEWNAPGMGASSTYSLGGALQNVMGDLTFVATGASTAVRLGNGGAGINLTVGGNFNVQGGSFILAQGHTSASTITIGGNLQISGGTLRLGNGNNTAINVLLNGNFIKTGGTLLRGSGSGAGTIRFNNGVQTYTNNATITDAVGFSVQSGSTLDLGSSSFLTGTGAFTLFAGSTINVGSTDAAGAIQLGNAGGNIRMSGVRTYQAGSTVIYNGVAAQFMSAGHPVASNTLLENPIGVTLVSNVTIGGTFTVSQGVFGLGANHTLTLNRNITVNSTFAAQQGRVIFGGSGPQTISASSNISFFDVAINQTASTSVDIAALTTVAIENSLDINSVSTLNAGTNQLTLLSTPTRTANVFPLAASSSIAGSVIVQRHLPKTAATRKGFHFLASPVTNNQFTDWSTEEPTLEVYRYDEPILDDFTRVLPLTSSIQNGAGYSVYINETGTFDVDSRGTLKQGNISIPVTSQDPAVASPDGWNLLGNPYASAIAWDNITLPPGNLIYDAVYITDHFNNSEQETGNGVTVHDVRYVDGVGTPAFYTGTIASGQAFWVKAAVNTSLNITESAKITPTDTEFFRKKEVPNVLRITLNGEGVKDETVVRLREGATDKFDGKYDAYKFFKGSPTGKISIATLTSDKVQAAINAFSTMDCDKSISLVTEGIIAGNYSMNFVGMESFEPGISISLKDLWENKMIDVQNEKSYSFAFTDQNASSAPTRFEILITNDVKPNSEILAVGETLCEDKDLALVTLETSQLGIQYSAEWSGEVVSEPIMGTGSSIQLAVKATTLKHGENKITVRAQAGVCSSTSLAEQATITKVRKPEITALQLAGLCNEGQATLVASGASEGGWYNWYEEEDSLEPIANQQLAEFVIPVLTKSKTYYVAGVNALGCEGNKVAVKADISFNEITPVVLRVEGSTLSLSMPGDKQWYLNNELLDGETSDTLNALESGLYSIKLTQGNCSVVLSHEVSFIGSENGPLSNSINIYPNPTPDKVFIKIITSNNDVTATMVSAAGVQIEKKTLTSENGMKVTEFDLLPYATGIYSVRIVDGKKMYIKKIAKVK